MGLKNELLDLKEKLQIAVDIGDTDTVEAIVDGWLDDGWEKPEIEKRFRDWTGEELEQHVF